MRSRANIYVDGLLGGYAFGIILNLCFAWWTERHDSPDSLGFGVAVLFLFVLLVVRRIKKHRQEDRELDQTLDRLWHEDLEQHILRWRGETKKKSPK